MEVLERRQLLAIDTWISPISGSWDVADNWNPTGVPGAGDDAVIDVPGVTVTISTNVSRSIASQPLIRWSYPAVA